MMSGALQANNMEPVSTLMQRRCGTVCSYRALASGGGRRLHVLREDTDDLAAHAGVIFEQPGGDPFDRTAQ